MTSSASAICGTRLGLTKLATSIRRTPASISRVMRPSLSAVGTTSGSFCKPSRAPTSTIWTLGRISISSLSRPSPYGNANAIAIWGGPTTISRRVVLRAEGRQAKGEGGYDGPEI